MCGVDTCPSVLYKVFCWINKFLPRSSWLGSGPAIIEARAFRVLAIFKCYFMAKFLYAILHQSLSCSWDGKHPKRGWGLGMEKGVYSPPFGYRGIMASFQILVFQFCQSYRSSGEHSWPRNTASEPSHGCECRAVNSDRGGHPALQQE